MNTILHSGVRVVKTVYHQEETGHFRMPQHGFSGSACEPRTNEGSYIVKHEGLADHPEGNIGEYNEFTSKAIVGKLSRMPKNKG